jgi:hypothetical protein
VRRFLLLHLWEYERPSRLDKLSISFNGGKDCKQRVVYFVSEFTEFITRYCSSASIICCYPKTRRGRNRVRARASSG